MAGHITKVEWTNKKGVKLIRYRARHPDPLSGGTDQVEKRFKTKTEAEDWLHDLREAARSGPREEVYEPMTFFADGRLGYDIQYLRREEIIVDILRHYERHRAVLADQRAQLLNRAPGHGDPA